MLPVGPLMVEHRLIERMIRLLAKEAKRIRATSYQVDTDIILTALEFIRLYADRSHHGKEEEILFRALKAKPLTAEHRRTLEALEAEHVQGRKLVEWLTLVRERVIKGEPSAPRDLVRLLEDLVTFYPAHIEKEDQDFFLPCMDYFTEEERAALLAEEEAFDRNLLHEHYRKLLDAREGVRMPAAQPQAPAGAVQGDRYGCMVCGYTYDPRLGDPSQQVPPGTRFEDLPAGWICPHCHVSGKSFVKVAGGAD